MNSNKNLVITEMFKEMIQQGYITPVASLENTEHLRFPGERPYIPTIATYGTALAPYDSRASGHAELEQRTQRNRS